MLRRTHSGILPDAGLFSWPSGEAPRQVSTLTLTVKVVPRASKSEIVGKMSDGTLKVRLAAVPEKGKANAELCAVIAREYGVPVSKVEVIAGATSTRKTVRIHP